MIDLEADPEPDQLAVSAHRRLDVHPLVSGVTPGDEMLDPVLDPLHRAREQVGGRADRQVLTGRVGLQPERATDVVGAHDDPVGRQAEDRGEVQAQGVRVLVRGVVGEPPGFWYGEPGPGLHGHAGVAVLDKGLAHDVVGERERRVDIAPGLLGSPQDVARGVVEQRRGVGRERAVDVGDDRERFEHEIGQLGCVLGEGARLGDDDGDDVARVPDAVDGQHAVGRDPQVPRRGSLEQSGAAGQVGTGEHGGDPWCRPSPVDVERHDAGVRLGAAHEVGVQDAGDREIVDETALSGQQTGILGTGNARPHEAHGRRVYRRTRARPPTTIPPSLRSTRGIDDRAS